ncbi:MAG: hypothetical protein GX811_06655 [Lentisphaerae bacterium]|nr:hypothetical protein [Lentisphaerota bacterium]
MNKKIKVIPGFFQLGLVILVVVIACHNAIAANLTWTGDGSDNLASTADNWGGAVPENGDSILLDGTAVKDVHWDLDITVSGWVQTEDYTGTVTFMTEYPGQGSFNTFVIDGDAVIEGGVWTHEVNPSTVTEPTNEKYRLSVSVTGDFTIGSDAKLDASTKGYGTGKGPGTSGNGQQRSGASHGGRGVVLTDKFVGPTYGSITDPINLGSGGGYSVGGGAILHQVAGTLQNNGEVLANGGPIDHYHGTGGSVMIIAGFLSGNGLICANGGSVTTGGVSPGGGGRVAVKLRGTGADFSTYTGKITAYGSQQSGGTVKKGIAGTIYKELPDDEPGKGELLIDNYGGLTQHGGLNTDLCGTESVTYEFRSIVLVNNAQLSVGEDDTLNIENTSIVLMDDNGIWLDGGTLLTTADFEFEGYFIGISKEGSVLSPADTFSIGNNATFLIDSSFETTTSLIVKDGGTISHTRVPAGEAEPYKAYLTVNGTMTIVDGGRVDVSARGFRSGYGPNTHPNVNSAGSYGGFGIGSFGCYGSIVDPDNYGAGGRGGGNDMSGGGVLRLTVTETLHNIGGIYANSYAYSQNIAAGGSIVITAGNLTGDGPIEANSLAVTSATNPGGGGRIAVTLTDPIADIFSYAGDITAYGAYNATKSGGAGTVYLRNPGEGLYEGTLIIDNNDNKGAFTEINSDVTDKTVANVWIRNAGHLSVLPYDSLVVSGNWNNEAEFTAQPNSSVIFAALPGGTSRIYGDSTFYALICVNPDQTLEFESGSTTKIDATGLLQLRGMEEEFLVVRPTSSGDNWNLILDETAEVDVEFIDLANSDASGGARAVALNSEGEEQGNINWSFVSLVAGEENTWTGSANSLWGVADNWDRNRPPVETDVIVIPAGCPRYPVFDADRVIDELRIEEGGQIDLNIYNLTVNKSLTVNGALITLDKNVISCHGSVDFTDGFFEPARSVLLLDADTAQEVNLAGLNFYTVDIRSEDLTVLGGFRADRLVCETDIEQCAIIFESGKLVSVRDFLVNGSVDLPNIEFSSSLSGVSWNLAVTGMRIVEGIKIKDCDASHGLGIVARESEDLGGNTNWFFDMELSLWSPSANKSFHTAANWTPTGVPGENSWVWVKEGVMAIQDESVTLQNFIVGGGSTIASVTANVPVTVRESVILYDKGELSLNKPSSIAYDLVLVSGSLLTHTANGDIEENKLELSIGGDFVVEEGASIDLKAKGYKLQKGPGATGGGAGTMGSSHGGRGAIYGSAVPEPGPCYGSIIAPVMLGSGGARSGSYGGGALVASVLGTFRNDGFIRADGLDNEQHYQATGGSVFITAGRMLGVGTIQANGGLMLVGGYASAAGGGRVSLVLTEEAATFDNYTGAVMANSTVLMPLQVDAKSSGVGTVYWETGNQLPGHGTVVIDGLNNLNQGWTDFPPPVHNDPLETRNATFRVINGAKLRLLDDCKAGDIWLDTADATLNLNGKTLRLNRAEHDIGPGNVINYGAIKWVQGSLYKIR